MYIPSLLTKIKVGVGVFEYFDIELPVIEIPVHLLRVYRCLYYICT